MPYQQGSLPDAESRGVTLNEPLPAPRALVQLGNLRIARGAGPRPVAEAGGVQAAREPAGAVPLQEELREVALRITGEQGAGVSDETARRGLRALARLGLLRPVGKGSATRYVLAQDTTTSTE
jgi:hypothetical protein